MSSMAINFPMNNRAAAVRLSAPRHPMRLTRRGRVVLFAAALLLALGGLLAWGPVSTATSEDVPRQTTHVVTLHSGDTLWALAAGLAGSSGDADAMVAQIMDMNNLSTALVHPGQKLRVPAL